MEQISPKILLLLVNDAARKGGWNFVGVYMSDPAIQVIMDVQRDAGLKVEERFEPVKSYGNGLECSWDESEEITADDLLPAMLYNITTHDDQFVRQFRAILLPLYGGQPMPYLDRWLGARYLPEWTRSSPT